MQYCKENFRNSDSFWNTEMAYLGKESVTSLCFSTF